MYSSIYVVSVLYLSGRTFTINLYNLYTYIRSELLMFWRTHYLTRNKDCRQLEKSSSIVFDNWKHIVDVMLNEDMTKRTSIMHYLSPTHRNSVRFHAVDYLARDG